MPLTRARFFMSEALALAREAEAAGEVPVGAVIVRAGEIVARGRNATRAMADPTAHAEIVAIRAAARALDDERLIDCDLYVTLEPCAMCAGAIAHARLRRVYYAAQDPKGGGVAHGPKLFEQPTVHHRPEVVSGIAEEEASALLKGFFAGKR